MLNLQHRAIVVGGDGAIIQTCITQRRIDALMTEDRLHGQNRRTGIEQQRRAGMTQLMGCQLHVGRQRQSAQRRQQSVPL
jgi:hypothetical protein